MIYLHINGKKSIEVNAEANTTIRYRMHGGLGGGAQQGSFFLKLSNATLGPGETLVRSPASNRRYEALFQRCSTRFDQRHKPSATAWGALGFLTQADVLQFLGSALAPRSDPFVIRAYGSSRGTDGKLKAGAWCEAVVQRSPIPMVPDDSGLNPKIDSKQAHYGRRFHLTRFRWLSRGEV